MGSDEPLKNVDVSPSLLEAFAHLQTFLRVGKESFPREVPGQTRLCGGIWSDPRCPPRDRKGREALEMLDEHPPGFTH